MTKATNAPKAPAGDSKIDSLDDEADGASAAAETAAAEAVHKVAGSNHDAELSGERQTIMVHAGQGDGGSDAVFLSINGYAYQIPRGKPVSVPTEVVAVLQNAVQTHYTQGPGGTQVAQDIPRFAFSLL